MDKYQIDILKALLKAYYMGEFKPREKDVIGCYDESPVNYKPGDFESVNIVDAKDALGNDGLMAWLHHAHNPKFQNMLLHRGEFWDLRTLKKWLEF